ncbi:MAG TPA: malate dehydrogenase [Actinomycetota bacterium]|nr:malate dehydrogenase [Actinomycetota bacterium]
MAKVTIVGAGNVGGAAAERLARSAGVDRLVLVDAVPGLAEGTALDIAQCAPLDGFATRVTGTKDYGPTEHSDVVVITAGRARQPGQSRLDLLTGNARVVSDVVAQVAARSPYAVLIVVTNPLDEMTHLAWRVSGFPPERVMGMAGMLDSARYRALLAGALKVGPAEVEAITLGSHGDTMVPVPSQATVGGAPIAPLLPAATLDRIAVRTRDGGAEIVALLKRGSAFHAPGASIAAMAEAVVLDRKDVLPACVWASGEYGIVGTFVGLPARLGRRGVEEVVELPLTDAERAALLRAAATIAERCRDLDRVLACA